MTELRRFQAVDALLFLFVLAVAFAVRASLSGWRCTTPQAPVRLAASAGRGRRSCLDKKEVTTELSGVVSQCQGRQGLFQPRPRSASKDESKGDRPCFAGLSVAAGSARPLSRATTRCGSRSLDARRASRGSDGGTVFPVRPASVSQSFDCRHARRRCLFVDSAIRSGSSASPSWEDGTLASFLLACGLALGARGIQTGGPLSSLLFGLAMAALAMVRAACLPFAFVAVAWYLLRSRSVTRGWLCALLAFLGFVNGLVPWTVQLPGKPSTNPCRSSIRRTITCGSATIRKRPAAPSPKARGRERRESNRAGARRRIATCRRWARRNASLIWAAR